MLNELKKSTANEVFYWFEKISEIPRGSMNEKKISDYIVNFAKERNLEFYQDSIFNIIIKKEASIGHENNEPLILSSHVDMVCVKVEGSNHNFLTDPLELYIDGENIRAKDTSLGADNGIGVAIMLAILDSEELVHPKIEAVFTVQEELGMLGAKIVDVDLLDGKRIISLDYTTEGEFLISSAGTTRIIVEKDYQVQQTNDMLLFNIKICGLMGGHSGLSIDCERANAIMLLGRIINDMSSKMCIKVNSINGGDAPNAIPNSANCKLFIYDYEYNILLEIVEKWQMVFKSEFKSTDNKIIIELEKIEDQEQIYISQEVVDSILKLLVISPNGVQNMSKCIENLVETSLNFGTISTKNGKVTVEISLRSSLEVRMEKNINILKEICSLLNFDLIIKSSYQSYEYNPDSKLREVCLNLYKKMYNKEAKTIAFHAGVEMGVFTSRIENLDATSFSPTLHEYHTTGEYLNIPSTEKVWDFIVALLKKI